MRLMYDSTNAADIPADAQMVAYYPDIPSSVPTPKPNVVYVRIARNVNENAPVLDVERGDATPEQAPAWTERQRTLGQIPSVYMNMSTWSTVRNAFLAQEVMEPLYWVAVYDGDPTIPAGAIAKQYIDPPASGGHYDISSVSAFWPGVDPEPQQEIGQVKYFQLAVEGSTQWIASVDGNGVLHLGYLPDSAQTGTEWGDNVVKLPNGSVAGGNKPNSPVEVSEDTTHSKLNVWTYGANGDRFHWQYDIVNNVWTGLSA